MPLSTVCVSTVSSRPRAWASYSNIRAKHVQPLTSMNSAEEISKYKEVGSNNCYSPTLNRRFLGYGYDFPEKSPKKEKKWSIGSFFRRSKKKDESDSTSEEDAAGQKKGLFLNRKKRKPEKKKKPNQIGGFDHVVISRNSHLYSNGFTHEDHGILSDPSGGFNSYSGRLLPRSQECLRRPIRNSHESLEISAGSGSIDSLAKKSRKGLAKVRAEARRVNLRHESSSDEDSQKSAASSSRFRSDESILGGLQREGSVSRRSRAARTERYFRRHSRDGENPKDYLRVSKSDAENSVLNWKNSDDSNRSLSRSPLVPKSKAKTSFSSLSSQSQSISGLSTIPPSHGSHSKVRVSNSTSNPSYKPPLSMNEYINTSAGRKLPSEYLNNQRSISCDANIHKSPSVEIDPEIIHVQFPLGIRPNSRYRNLSLIDTRLIKSAQVRQPPPPPPRDPRRLVTAQYYENSRPNTYYFDGTQTRSKSFNVTSPQPSYSPQTKKKNSFNLHTGRSTSEDHLPKTPVPVIQRPSSTTPESSGLARRYIKRQSEAVQPLTNPENFNYLTDKKPRSRKPIFIQTSKTPAENPDKNGTQKALDFWKQKDREGKPQGVISQSRNSKSPQMFTCQTHVQTQVFLPSVLQNDINNDNLANSAESLVTNDNAQESVSSSFKPIKPPEEVELTAAEVKHKSTNLEEALDELEAIYNSLRLGDEDLLERAEQREKDVQAQRLREKRPELYWAMSQSQRGALSDSSFSYEPFDSVDSPRRRRLLKKSQTVDRRGDDMAFRKLNKERSATINDPQSSISKVSYLQASPLMYTKETSNELEAQHATNEPDITLDDVVYRNIKFANNVPRVVETQPPFGIPVGPITKAANSDYLHAVPDTTTPPRSAFKPRKIPDLVKDDLAFRNLRKDQGKEPALPPLSPEDLKNNNASTSASCEQPKFDIASLKKKRAVRSLSANIGSLINKDVLVRGLERYKDNNNADNEFNDLSNIADAMEIARQVLKEKENRINATRRGFLSDNDTNNGNCELKESRMNFLNSLNGHTESSKSFLNAKPPRGLTPDRKSPRTTKESTPIPVSPMEDKVLGNGETRDSSFDDLLTALATEARETSERITSELKHFGEIDEDEGVNKQLSEIDAVSDQAKLCEKLLEGVVDTDLMAAEVVEQIDDEPVIMESVANIVLTRDDSKIDPSLKSDAKVEKVKESCESDHDYENLKSDEELNFNVNDGGEGKKCPSPFEEHKAELIASFQELKNNIDIEIPSHIVQRSSGDDDGDGEEEEERKLVAGEDDDDECVLDCQHLPASNPLECACVVRTSPNNKKLFVSNCDMIISCSNTNNNSGGRAETLSDAESAPGYRPSPHPITSRVQSKSLESLDSLKSPKLVLQTAKLSKSDSLSDKKQVLENQSMISRNCAPEAPPPSSSVELRRGNRGGKCGPSGAWYRDPATVAVACSYGIACAHQLASLDFVAILGLLFAVLSFIAALIL